MTQRTTISDLARAAGVSVATVDRVLNQRHPVREDTANRVLRAAESLGFHAAALMRRRVEGELPARRLGFLLQRRATSFYQQLAQALISATEAASGIRGRPIVAFMEELTPSAVAATMKELGPRVDALCIVALDHPHISEAVALLRERGVPCFTLLSDVSAEGRAGYLGLDGRKVGRTAAWTVARTARRPGSVGVVLGSHRYLGQELAEISFRSYFREHAPAFTLLETMINLEDPHIAQEATITLLRRHPDLVGLYVGGGGVEGVIQALRDAPPEQRPTLVCNEMTPETRAALIDDIATLVLNTPVGPLAARCVEAMVTAIGAPPAASPAQILLPFEIFVSENIP
jgi:LacI family transcriptional regulator